MFMIEMQTEPSVVWEQIKIVCAVSHTFVQNRNTEVNNALNKWNLFSRTKDRSGKPQWYSEVLEQQISNAVNRPVFESFRPFTTPREEIEATTRVKGRRRYALCEEVGRFARECLAILPRPKPRRDVRFTISRHVMSVQCTPFHALLFGPVRKFFAVN